jgi:predicted PurR-regulated permease PerM
VSLVTLALLVGFAAIAGSLVLVVTRSYELWRTSREFFRALDEANDAVTASLERLSDFEPRGLDRLAASTARLEASRARLGVLTTALGRVRGQWAGLVGVYPKK